MTPVPIVHQLQRLAAERSTDLPTVLRHALIVASKLKVADFEQWILRELKGYSVDDELPGYRTVKTRVYMDGPRGLVDIHFSDSKIASEMTKYDIRSSVSQISALLETTEGPDLGMGISSELALHLIKAAGGGDKYNPVIRCSSSYFKNILEAVRSVVLEWALTLEKEGIVGSELSFTPEEVGKATDSATVHIQNFQGILGNISNSNVSQSLTQRVVCGDSQSLRAALSEAGITQEDVGRLEEAMAIDPKPTAKGVYGPNVSKWLGTMMSKAASGVWDVGTSVAGSLLSSALGDYYGIS